MSCAKALNIKKRFKGLTIQSLKLKSTPNKLVEFIMSISRKSLRVCATICIINIF